VESGEIRCRVYTVYTVYMAPDLHRCVDTWGVYIGLRGVYTPALPVTTGTAVTVLAPARDPAERSTSRSTERSCVQGLTHEALGRPRYHDGVVG
jgi:hypothetical protein